MTCLAVLDREGDVEVAHAAELAFQNIFHPEMFRALFFDVENVGVTVGAIKPHAVCLMREDRERRFGHIPFRL